MLATLEAARRVRESLTRSAPQAPRLASLARTLPDLQGLARALAALITPEGEVRDEASPELARARRRVRELEAEVERIMARALRDPEVLPHLQDDYATFRENRPVLPVRAGSGQRVRGIVHDVSSSGTTVFIEPEAAVEAGNRLRIARTEVERETLRVLRRAPTRCASAGSSSMPRARRSRRSTPPWPGVASRAGSTRARSS